MECGLFVTGTDTGVGKTAVAGGLAAILRRRGLRVGVLKPVQTGAIEVAGRYESEDIKFLAAASGCAEDQALICPYRLKLPAAPSLAAEAEGIEINLEVIKESYYRLAKLYDIVIVEGAGGLMVPLVRDYTFLNLAQELELPVVIVARSTLGTINHSVLTANKALAAGLDVHGIILNYSEPWPEGVVEKNNPRLIGQLTRAPILGILPYSPKVSVEKTCLGNMPELMEEHLALGPLFSSLGVSV